MNFSGDIGQIQCFFNGGIVIVDDGNFLVMIEEVIISCVGRNFFIFECFF